MSTAKLPSLLHGLPPLLQVVLQHEENGVINDAIITKFSLNDQQADQIISIIRRVIQQTLKPVEVQGKIQSELNVDNETAKKIALDLLGWRFLPMEWYVGGVSEEIAKLGGNADAYRAIIAPLYPEVFGSEPEGQPTTEPQSAETTAHVVEAVKTDPSILHNIDDRLTSTKGRAEILLRMAALSQQIEQAGKQNQISEKESGELLHSLDALSYAVNTKDLNPLEIAAIKRRMKSILSKLPTKS